MNLFKLVSFFLIIFSFLIAFIIFPVLPNSIPIHWGVNGVADGFGSPISVFFFPGLLLFVFVLFLIIPKLMVFKKNFLKFEKDFWVLNLVIEFFLFSFFIISLYSIFNNLNINFFVIFLISFLFIIIGFLLPSFKRNFFVGIRTPWTLASDKVWVRTHEFGGKVFIFTGLISLLSIFFGFYFLLAIILISVFSLIVFSFIEFNKD